MWNADDCFPCGGSLWPYVYCIIISSQADKPAPLRIKCLPFLPDWAIILPADCWRPHRSGHFLRPCSCVGCNGDVVSPLGWRPHYPATTQSLGVVAAGWRWRPLLTLLVLQAQRGGQLQIRKNMCWCLQYSVLLYVLYVRSSHVQMWSCSPHLHCWRTLKTLLYVLSESFCFFQTSFTGFYS